MKRNTIVALLICVSGLGLALANSFSTPSTVYAAPTQALRCVAFSPYVSGYDPEYGPHPPPSLIDALLDKMVNSTGVRCIMTYGMLNGLDHTFQAAQDRGIKVIAIIWLDTDDPANTASITLGIQKAKQYPDTIIRLSCGSEVRVRHGAAIAEPIIRNCLNQFKAAGVAQPVTSIDTWWGWCNETWPCQKWGLADDVDWIGINVFPWWENKFSGLFPCTTAAQAADFHIARFQDIIARYPGKEVILTEFGWPMGPAGYHETNQNTGQQCGEASIANQSLVLQGTLARLDQLGLPGVVFESFRENWKVRSENPVGPFWGFCDGVSPYACNSPFPTKVFLPGVAKNWCPTAIRFTHVPPYGSYEDLRGQVDCVQPANYKVAVYIYVSGWWTKPYWNQPLTQINADGSWICDVTTGGNDQLATQFEAFLIPNGYTPPTMSGGQTFPTELFQNAVKYVLVNR